MYPHRAFKRIFKHDKAQAPAGSSTFSGLDTAKIVLQATANLGDGALTVPGLKAAAQLALQIIDIAKKVKGNQEDCVDLAEHIAQLLVPVAEALQRRTNGDVDLRLKADLLRLNGDLEKILGILKSQADRGKFRRVVNHIGDGEI